MPTRLRDDVRKAFERQQTALGEIGDARHRLMQNALAGRDAPATPGLQWVAGIAAILIAAIVITTFVIARASSHTHAVPAATPSPKARTSSGPAPAGVPLVLFRRSDAAAGNWDSGAAWDGRFYDLTKSVAGVVSPDGEHVLDYVSGRTVVTNRDTGAQQDLGMSLLNARWADDNLHFCVVLDRPGSPGSLGPNGQKQEGLTDLWWVDSVTGDRRLIAHFGSWAFNGWVPDITACSATGDLAALDMQAVKAANYNELYVVRVSSGAVIQDVHLSADSYPVMSHDGSLTAVNDTTGGGASFFQTAAWSAAGALHGLEVRGMAWDGNNFLVVDPATAGTTNQGRMNPRLVDRTGKVLWRSPVDSSLDAVVAEPGGSLVAVAFLTRCRPPSCPGQLWIVGSRTAFLVASYASIAG